MAQKYPDAMRSVKQSLMQRMIAYGGDEQERVLFNLALLFSDEGDNKTAEHYLRMAIKIKPDFRSALFNLALILLDAQRYYEAEIYLIQLITHHPDHDKSLLLLGDIYIEFSQLDKAEEVCLLSSVDDFLIACTKFIGKPCECMSVTTNTIINDFFLLDY